MTKMLRITLACVILMAPAAFGQFAATGTTSVSVTVAAEAAIRIDTATTTLTAPSLFADYVGTTSFTYKVRTGTASGAGTITLQVTSDFGAGGPSVATPPSAGDTLAYTCTVAAPATGCTGSLNASTSAATSVATFSHDAHSLKAGTTGSTGWVLTNDPVYKVGTYSATVTYTISAT